MLIQHNLSILKFLISSLSKIPVNRVVHRFWRLGQGGHLWGAIILPTTSYSTSIILKLIEGTSVKPQTSLDLISLLHIHLMLLNFVPYKFRTEDEKKLRYRATTMLQNIYCIG